MGGGGGGEEREGAQEAVAASGSRTAGMPRQSSLAAWAVLVAEMPLSSRAGRRQKSSAPTLVNPWLQGKLQRPPQIFQLSNTTAASHLPHTCSEGEL